MSYANRYQEPDYARMDVARELRAKTPYEAHWNGQLTDAEIRCAVMSGMVDRSEIGR